MSRKRSSLGEATLEWVSIDDMDIDTYQRPLDLKRAEKIGAEFNPDVFGYPTLSLRESGRYVIIDGQHRIYGLRHAGWNGQLIQCRVHRNLTRAQEAALFVQLQEFRPLRFVDRFLARIEAQEPVAVQIAKIVQEQGYVIDRTARDGAIVATKALEDVYSGRGQKVKGANPVALRSTLMAITSAWGRTKAAVNGHIILGVGAFFLRYGNNVDMARLVSKLIAIGGGPDGLIQRGKGKQELHGGSLAHGIAHYLTEHYNRGIRGRGRLPGWRDSGR